jgi:hypothetical protein
MQLNERFRAWGHQNIRASHKTTLMVTRETELTTKGDCIVAVAAEKGLKEFSPEIKAALKSPDADVKLTLSVDGHVFQISGKGDPGLTLSHPTDIIARKSGYVCDRTLMVYSDKVARDIEPCIVELLRSREQVIEFVISVKS